MSANSRHPLVWVQRVVVATILVLFFQGKGSHATFVAIGSFVPILRLLSSSVRRQRLLTEAKRLWNELEAFSRARTQIPWRAVLIFAVLPTLALALSNGRSMTAGDNLPVMLIASSILVEGNTELSEWTRFGETLDAACLEGGALPHYLLCTHRGMDSAYPIGMLAIALPFSTVSAAVGGSLEDRRARWRLSKWAASWVAACCIGLFLIIALHAVSARVALFAALLLSSGSAVFSTVGQGLWTQGGVALAVLIIICVEVRTPAEKAPWHSTGSTSGVVWRIACVQALAIAFAAACRLTSIAVILPLLAWIAIRAPRRALAVVIVAAVALVPVGLYYEGVYGNVLGPQMLMGSGAGWAADPLSGLAGILVSPARGLLVYQPWLLLGFAACFASVRGRIAEVALPRGWQWMCLCAVALHLGIVSLWPEWWGGWSWGSRLVTETLPFLALLLLFPLETVLKTRSGTAAVAMTLVVSFAMHVPGVYLGSVDWMKESGKSKELIEARLWDWTDPPFLFPFRDFRGETPRSSQ